MPHFHEPGRMCGNVCALLLSLHWFLLRDTKPKKKKREDKVFSSTHTRHWFFFFFFSVSSSKGGRNGDGCRSYRLSILSVEPCVKEKQVFFSFFFLLLPSFCRCCAAAVCVWDGQVLIMRLCVSSSAHTCIQYIHLYNTVTPRHNATKPPILCLTVMPWMQKQQQPYGLT